MIVDTHTHIYLEKDYQDYIGKAKERVSIMISLHSSSFDLEHIMSFAETKNNLYVVAGFDANDNIKSQLKKFDTYFREGKIVGLKLYPGYQKFYPSDKVVFGAVELCQKYGQPIILHSGDFYGAKDWAYLKYSQPIYIDDLAVKFPGCKIIISHFGFPNFLDTACVVSKNPNVYVDISGTIDNHGSDKEVENLTKQYAGDLQRVYTYFPNIKNKTLFGTDYSGESTPLNQVEPYIKVVEKIFSKTEQEEVFSSLAKKLFFNK